MEQNGFTVNTKDLNGPEAQDAMSQVPAGLEGCHTAIVDGYVIEGHVPASDVRRLLKARPDAVGLAVPGMPTGSPGMEVAGGHRDPFEVLLVDRKGGTTVFARYG